MVATSRNRRAGGTTATEAEGRVHNQCSADGRRQLLGLTQAIRQKAHQSTSPSSEARHERSGISQKPKPKQPTSTTGKLHSPRTIEERLRSLLNSDTEEKKEMKALKKATSMIAPHHRSKTPAPTLPEKMSKKKAFNEAQERNMFKNCEDDCVSRGHRASPELRIRTQLQNVNHPSQPPRCQSAVPPSFDVVDSNRLISSSQHQIEDNRNRINRVPVPQQGWTDEKKGAVPGYPPSEYRLRPNSTGPCFHRRPISEYGKAGPAFRRSMNFEAEKGQPSNRLAVESNPNLNTSMRLGPPPSQAHVNLHIQDSSFYHSTPMVNRNASQHFVNNGHQQQHVLGQKHAYALRVSGSPGQADLRTCNTPSPSAKKVDSFETYPAKEAKAKPTPDQKPLMFTSPAPHMLHPNNKDYYPQQNFSFRRAVHRSISSESERYKTNDSKCRVITRQTSPLSGDKSSRKSDDRDSGTVVEPEASVFDFDSSVLTEEERETERIKSERKSPSSHFQSQEKETSWSRSSTPILPPLSFEEDGQGMKLGPGKLPKEIESEIIYSSSFTQRQTQNVVLENGKPENKANPLQRSAEGLRLTANGAAELSPTESALSERLVKKHEQRSKVISSKLQRGPSANRRSFRHRNSSGDERKQKSRHRRAYDDSDITDCSMQQATYKLPNNRKHHRDPAYRTSYHSVTNDRAEFGETSSVRSVTTTSVCSSVLRRTGSRRHYRKNQLSGEKYSRELRSVSKRFTRLESHVVTLARSLAQLSSELRQQNVTSREIEQLRHEMQELKARQMLTIEPKARKGLTSSASKNGSQPKVKKLVKFFGEQPPLLTLFLKQLGYEKYMKNFENESIGMMELPYMDEKRLQDIGIPLGPRLRIMKEAQKSSYV